MDKLIIKKYIADNKRVSIPEIQFKFSLSYKETREFFQELESAQAIELEDDIYYVVTSDGETLLPHDEPSKNQDEEDTAPFDRQESGADRLRARLEARREELKRRLAESACSEEEDDEDEDEETIDEIKEEVLRTLSSRKEASAAFEEEKEPEDEKDPFEYDDDLLEMREEAMEGFKQDKVLRETVAGFGCNERFVKEGDDYFCNLGIAYPDDTEMKFKLSYTNQIILSDCGRTYKYMSKYFNMADEQIIKRIEMIMDGYAVKLKAENGESELYIQIRDKKSAFMSFLWLFSTIERILCIQTEGILGMVLNELEALCKNEAVRIFIEEEASFSEAKERVQELYKQAEEENDTMKKSAYKNLLAALEEITEEGYDSFKSMLLGYEEE